MELRGFMDDDRNADDNKKSNKGSGHKMDEESVGESRKHQMDKKVESQPEERASGDGEFKKPHPKTTPKTEGEDAKHQERVKELIEIVESASKARTQWDMDLQLEKLLKMEVIPPLPVCFFT